MANLFGLGVWAITLFVCPRLFDPFVSAKWMVVYAFAFLASLAWVFKPYRLPNLGPFWSLVLLTVLLYFLSMAWSWPGHYDRMILDVTSGGLLIFGAYQGFRKRSELKTFLGYVSWLALPMSLYALAQVCLVYPWPDLVHDRFPHLLFGNVNFAAEFWGFSILCQLLRLRLTEKWRTGILILVPSLACLYLTGNRAASLALVLSLPFVLSRPRLYILAAPWLVIGGLVLGWTGVPRSSTILERFTMWRNTLHMIKDHPEGVGPGRFEFEYLPYAKGDTLIRETSLHHAPHNGYLEAVVESGWVFGLIFFLTIGVFLWRVWRSSRSPYRDLVLAGFAFVMVDACFSFPLETPLPFFFTCLFVGIGFRLIEDEDYFSDNLDGLIFVTLTSIITLCLGSIFCYTKFVERYKRDSITHAERACNLAPYEWLSCLNAGTLNLMQGNIKKAEALLNEMLSVDPNNFLALKFLAITQYEHDDQVGACNSLKKYEQLLGEHTSFHSIRLSKCPESH